MLLSQLIVCDRHHMRNCDLKTAKNTSLSVEENLVSILAPEGTRVEISSL